MNDKKWYQKVSNWLFILICLVLVPVLILNISIMIQAHTNEDEVPSVFGYKPFIVLSGSMETEIHQGDLIITKITEPEELKVDDIIAFRDDENTVTTHRIIDIVEKEGETYFVTKGDNNNTQDQNLVEYDDVEGIYVLRIPAVGTIMSTLAEPITIVIIVAGITVIFTIGFTISNRKLREQERLEFLEYKRMKEEEAKKADEEIKLTKVASPKKSTASTKKKTTSTSKKATPSTKSVAKKSSTSTKSKSTTKK